MPWCVFDMIITSNEVLYTCITCLLLTWYKFFSPINGMFELGAKNGNFIYILHVLNVDLSESHVKAYFCATCSSCEIN